MAVVNITYTFNSYDDMQAASASADETAYCVETLGYYKYSGGAWVLERTVAVHSVAVAVANSNMLDESNVLLHSTSARVAESELLDEANVLVHSTSASTTLVESGGNPLYHGA